MSPSACDSCDPVGAGTRKPYERGRKRQLSEAWKQAVRDRLAELGHGHKWLEVQIGAGSGAITKMLQPDHQFSGLVDPVCEFLGIDPPMIAFETSSDEERALLDMFREMTADQRQHLLGLLGVRRKPAS